MSAVLAGTGAVEKTTAGTVILSGANSYVGGTTVGTGTLLLAGAGTLGSTTGATGVAGATLDLGGTAQTQNGGLTLAGGTLQNGTLSSSGTFALQAGMAGAALAGTGAAEKTTAGMVVLDGANSYSGGTTVSGGTLEVGDANHPGASIAGDVAIGSGGTLMGHGTIGGNVANAGTVEPGGTIGVLTVSGNYTESNDGTLRIEITPDVAAGPGVGYDQLRIGGTASLAGALSIIDDLGSTDSLGSRYTILTAAGGRSGAFSAVSYDPILATYISPQVTYDANNVYLALAPTPSPSGGPPPLFNGGQEVPDALTALASTAAGVGDAVLGDGCAPEARRPRGGQGTEQHPGCVVGPLGAGLRSEVWMRGIGGVGNLSGGGSRMSFDDDYAGVLIGAGVSRGGFTVGLGGGFAATALNFADGSNAAQNAVVGFVYGRYERGPLRLGAMGAYGGGQVNGTRELPGTGLAANGDRPGNFAVVEGRAVYDFAAGALTLEPRATLAWLHAGQSGFSESGAGLLDLTYPDTHVDQVAGRLTARAMEGFTAGSWSLEPWAEAGVQETFSGLSRRVVVTDGAFSSVTAGVSPAPTAGVLGAGLDGRASPRLDLFIRYQGLFSANQTANAFGAGLRVRF
ncbi:MAG: autotransporter domain-containing protein [Acetobacteraceae bacterium]